MYIFNMDIDRRVLDDRVYITCVVYSGYEPIVLPTGGIHVWMYTHNMYIQTVVIRKYKYQGAVRGR